MKVWVSIVALLLMGNVAWSQKNFFEDLRKFYYMRVSEIEKSLQNDNYVGSSLVVDSIQVDYHFVPPSAKNQYPQYLFSKVGNSLFAKNFKYITKNKKEFLDTKNYLEDRGFTLIGSAIKEDDGFTKVQSVYKFKQFMVILCSNTAQINPVTNTKPTTNFEIQFGTYY